MQRLGLETGRPPSPDDLDLEPRPPGPSGVGELRRHVPERDRRA